MLANCTASVIAVETDTDDLGNSTVETFETVLAWALIAPRTSSERTDPRSPAVVTAATLYGPFGVAIDADDLVVIAGHSATFDGEWQVEGMPGQWSLNGWTPGFEVALTRAG